MGFIGTPDNNNASLNTGIFANNEIPAECLFANAGDATSVYFADAAALLQEYTGKGITSDKFQAIQTRMGAEPFSSVFGIYTDAKSYYRLNITEKDAGAGTVSNLVRRNFGYNGSITSFSNIGEPLPGDLNNEPDKEVDETKTNIHATISIIPWKVLDVPGDL